MIETTEPVIVDYPKQVDESNQASAEHSEAVHSLGGGANLSATDILMNELVRLRKKQKIGQEPVARAIGISQGRVSQMESLKGGLTLDAVVNYAKAIGAEIVIVPENRTKKKDRKTSETI
jgi:predicted XRE-type DNA-binding protein